MTNQNLSDVEIFWNALKSKTGDARDWHDLTPNQQLAIIQAINMVIGVVSGRIA